MNDPLWNPQPSAASLAPARLLLLMDHSLDFVELLGAGGVILGVSAGITAVAGYQPDELVGSHYKDFIHPDDYRRGGEAFANILAGAVWRTAGILKVAIRDDGVGFDPTATHAGEGGAGHLGLESMRERAALAGGRLTVESSVGTGTIISAELPTIGFESGAAAPEDG